MPSKKSKQSHCLITFVALIPSSVLRCVVAGLEICLLLQVQLVVEHGTVAEL
jgi:hypothetical protein